jgi:integrase
MTGATRTGRGESGLKPRAKTASRDAPVAPPLAELLARHLDEFGTGRDGRLFVTRRGPGGMYVFAGGQPVPSNTYTLELRLARQKAQKPAQIRSPLARVPYSLRHAAVSLWLNAGVLATRSPSWPGHSVHVLLKVHARCTDGQDAAARRRIEASLLLEMAKRLVYVFRSSEAGSVNVDGKRVGPHTGEGKPLGAG